MICNNILLTPIHFIYILAELTASIITGWLIFPVHYHVKVIAGVVPAAGLVGAITVIAIRHCPTDVSRHCFRFVISVQIAKALVLPFFATLPKLAYVLLFPSRRVVHNVLKWVIIPIQYLSTSIDIIDKEGQAACTVISRLQLHLKASARVHNDWDVCVPAPIGVNICSLQYLQSVDTSGVYDES